MSFKGFALPQLEKVLTLSHPAKLSKPVIDSKSNSSAALQKFIDVTKFSPTALISIFLLEFFKPVRK